MTMKKFERATMWKRLDGPGHDVCSWGPTDDGIRMMGTAVFMSEARPCSLGYLVDAGTEGRVRSAHVFGTMGADLVDVFVSSIDGRWRLDGRPQAAGADADLELGFTPASILCLLRRHALAVGGQVQVDAVALRLGRIPALVATRRRIRRLSASDYAIDGEDGRRWSAVRVDGQLCAVRVAGRWELEVEPSSAADVPPLRRCADLPAGLEAESIHAAE